MIVFMVNVLSLCDFNKIKSGNATITTYAFYLSDVIKFLLIAPTLLGYFVPFKARVFKEIFH